MAVEPYARKVRASALPAVLQRATLVLTYAPSFADGGGVPHLAEKTEAAMVYLATLAGCGLAGASELGFAVAPVTLPSGKHALTVELFAPGNAPLPPPLVIMALRMMITLHDNSPAEFLQLKEALDGDAEAALAIWAGVDFTTAVEMIEVGLAGSGPLGAFDPLWIGMPNTPLLDAERLDFPGLAQAMPDPDLEDALLLASAFGAFCPSGQRPGFELGEEEWFTDGGALVVTELSCEPAALDLVVAMLRAWARDKTEA